MKNRLIVFIILIILLMTGDISGAPPQGSGGQNASTLCSGDTTYLSGEGNCNVVIGGGGTGSLTTIEESDVQVGGSDIVIANFGSGFDIIELPDTQVNITLDLTEKKVVLTTEVTGVLPDANVADNITLTNLSQVSDADYATQTLTNKTLNTASNTITVVEADISNLSHVPSADVVGTTILKDGSDTPVTDECLKVATATTDVKYEDCQIGHTRYYERVIIDSATDVTVATSIQGDFRFPFSCTITDVYAYVNTAGTTGTMTVDIHKAGTTIMTTNKISIDTTEKHSDDAGTAPVITTTVYAANDILTADVDVIQTTAAKGLTVGVGCDQT